MGGAEPLILVKARGEGARREPTPPRPPPPPRKVQVRLHFLTPPPAPLAKVFREKMDRDISDRHDPPQRQSRGLGGPRSGPPSTARVP